MDKVHEIIAAFGSQTEMAEATGIAQQTISEWHGRNPPEIPPWRRSYIAAILKDKGLSVGAEAAAYLASTSRTPRVKISAEQPESRAA